MKRTCFWIAFALCVLNASAYAKESKEQTGKEMKPALLVIDIQNEYLPYMAEKEKDIALRVINGAIVLFRENGFPIIRVYHTDPQYGPKPDTEAFEFPSSIFIEDTDPKIIKNYPSAFTKTDLEKTLDDLECNTLFLCGLSAVGCVLATYHGAVDRDFKVFMIKDGLMSHNSTYTDVIEDISNTINYTTLKFMLEYR
ncbi:MAG: isochorismatase family protein [Candidatus Latescibacteria bacterium]|nr:isochorismatase family protein [Candidatus Latescibacterota bacterium]NIO57426.1 isochorismatase family protein [Candidatus Latescibacterota bacterium]